jgi:2-deoxy-D-gluconate 3-dehydrogenase
MFELTGKTALVTGAATGIGQGIVLALAKQGARVAVSDKPEESLSETAALIKNHCPGYLTLGLDVRDKNQIVKGVAETLRAFGRIDILVNNAGINKPQSGLEAEEDNWDNTYNTNVKGAFRLTQQVVPRMIEQQWGRVIFVSSQSGLVAIPGQPIYCSSKGAIIQLARTLGVEWAKYNITVNTIAPTFVITNLTRKRLENPEFLKFCLGKIPAGRLAKVDDVAAAAVFLASEEANMVNCHTLSVDGGWTVW